jgi:hypothetical protein
VLLEFLAMAILRSAMLLPRGTAEIAQQALLAPAADLGHCEVFGHPAFPRMVFFCRGLATPGLVRKGWAGEPLIALVWPPGLGVSGLINPQAGCAGTRPWALWCVCASAVSLAPPAPALHLLPALAGRALSLFNLVMFAAVFLFQWVFGLCSGETPSAGVVAGQACQRTDGDFALACALLFLWLHLGLSRNAAAREPLPACG